MLEDNQIFEVMIHMMELGMVIGIAAVVAFTVLRNRHEFRAHPDVAPGSAQDARSHHG